VSETTDEIAAFYAARLAELQAAAEANARPDGEWARYICDPIIGPFGGQTRERNIGRGMYAAEMSDPSRVLRRVAAGRKLILRYRIALGVREEDNDSSLTALVGQMRDEVTVWDDHPDYKELWRP
jgi:hypothetical protein